MSFTVTRRNFTASPTSLLSVLPLYALTMLALPACATRAPVAPSSSPVVQQPAIAPALDKAANAELDQNTLSQSIQDSLTGLALESPAARSRIEQQALSLVTARKARNGSAIRKQHAQACLQDEPRDAYQAVFCRLWVEASGVRGPRAHRAQSLAKSAWGRKRLKDLRNAIGRGDLSHLSAATDTEVAESLKKAPGGLRLRPLIESALNNQNCVSTTLLTSLGFRMEEEFPDSDYRDLAEALYSRSAECADDLAAAKASYRLGLLQIWAEKYAEAGKTFDRLIGNRNADDYRSRVIYWRYFAAKQSGDAITRDRMLEVLAKDHHLTLHGLITVGPKPTDNRPTVMYRSEARPQFNAAIRVAEALLAVDGKREATIALDTILDELTDAEPNFQLYVGLLLMRAGDSIRKFRVLSGLYREFPGLLSNESLQMLFPLSRFEIVRVYEQGDPYLMISLIRQESAFNERARSPVGAVGLMQLMPGTARHMERVSKTALYDPNVNIRLGVRFFTRLRQRYNGDAELALAAYNAGPENVDTWRSRYPVANRLLFVDLIPFRETREYVASIARNYFWYKRLYETPIGRSPASDPSSEAQSEAQSERTAPIQPENFTFSKLFKG